jgi:hypothetical protein
MIGEVSRFPDKAAVGAPEPDPPSPAPQPLSAVIILPAERGGIERREKEGVDGWKKTRKFKMTVVIFAGAALNHRYSKNKQSHKHPATCHLCAIHFCKFAISAANV